MAEIDLVPDQIAPLQKEPLRSDSCFSRWKYGVWPRPRTRNHAAVGVVKTAHASSRE